MENKVTWKRNLLTYRNNYQSLLPLGEVRCLPLRKREKKISVWRNVKVSVFISHGSNCMLWLCCVREGGYYMPLGGVLELQLSCPKSQHNGVVKALWCTGAKYPLLPSFSVFSKPLFIFL